MRLIHTAGMALFSTASGWAQSEAGGVPEFDNLSDAFTFGLQVMVVGMGAVFLGLMTVYIFLVFLKRISTKRPQRSDSGERHEEPPEVTAEIAHAIALALWMDLRVFDEEAAAEEITVRKVTRPFSPWWNSGRIQNIHDKIDIFRKWG